MPRLTNTAYLQHRKLLLEVWRHHRTVFIVLKPNEQLDLHQFFQLTAARPDDKLLRYRAVLTELYPALPQRAGRAYRRLERLHTIASKFGGGDRTAYNEAVTGLVGVPATAQHGGRAIYVRGEVHPEIDTKRLARALLAAVSEQEAGYVRPTKRKARRRRPSG